MTARIQKNNEATELTVEQKLTSLFTLQTIDSKFDEIQRLRGELPLEVQDLEDELVGLETRINNIKAECSKLEQNIADKKNAIIEAKERIKKYTAQQDSVRNNREYESITKEIEYENLDINLSEKKIKEYQLQLITKKTQIEEAENRHQDRQKDLENCKQELENIIKDTQKDEEEIDKKRQEIESQIEERLLTAYKRIRGGAKNGLAVVRVERNSCGGCYNKIPAQRQLDVASHKKVIVCEYCGRILIDNKLAMEVTGEVAPDEQ